MRTIAIKTLMILMICLEMGFVQAQNIRVFFFAPTATLQANFTGANAAYIRTDSCGTGPTGYSYVIVDARTVVQFRASAPPRMHATYDSLVTANSLMRRRISSLRTLSNGLVNNVEIYLFDDTTGLPPGDSCHCDEIFGPLRGAWPCADNMRLPDGSYLGYMTLGELSANHIIRNAAGGYWAWHETVVHEFSHTQFANEYNAAGRPVRNKWGSNGVGISYGGDSGHWGDELMADQQMALDEGLATVWGLIDNRPGRDTLINFLNDKGNRFALGSHSFLTGTPSMWNAPHAVVASGTIPANRKFPIGSHDTIQLVSPHIQTGARYELRSYKWLDVPGDYIFYNEQMFQAFGILFHEFAFANRDTAFNMILKAAKGLTPPRERLRYPAAMANRLALQMEQYAATARGRADETAGTLTSSMFVYALYDILTHFGMTDANLQRELSINMATYVPFPVPQAYAAYMAQRNAVKQIACPFLEGSNCAHGAGNIDILRAVTDVRTYFRDPSRILR